MDKEKRDVRDQLSKRLKVDTVRDLVRRLKQVRNLARASDGTLSSLESLADHVLALSMNTRLLAYRFSEHEQLVERWHDRDYLRNRNMMAFQVVRSLSEGNSLAATAKHLGVSPQTARNLKWRFWSWIDGFLVNEGKLAVPEGIPYPPKELSELERATWKDFFAGFEAAVLEVDLHKVRFERAIDKAEWRRTVRTAVNGPIVLPDD